MAVKAQADLLKMLLKVLRDNPAPTTPKGISRYAVRTKMPKAASGHSYHMELVGFDRNPWIDIDIPDISHTAAATTAKDLGHALDQLLEYTGRTRGAGGSVYLTPGGVRYSEQVLERLPKDFWRTTPSHIGDPLYKKLSQKRRAESAIVKGKPGKNPQYTVRLNPKPRKGDFVAKEILQIGEKANPQIRARIKRWHDDEIKEYVDEVMGRAWRSKLIDQLGTVDPKVRRRILETVAMGLIVSTVAGGAAMMAGEA
jgi:hypothetical protein